MRGVAKRTLFVNINSTAPFKFIETGESDEKKQKADTIVIEFRKAGGFVLA